jgi:hypothetical protein
VASHTFILISELNPRTMWSVPGWWLRPYAPSPIATAAPISAGSSSFAGFGRGGRRAGDGDGKE